MKNQYKNILLLFVILFISSCEKQLDTQPNQAIDADNLITDANSANTALNGLYSSLQDFYGSTAHIIIELASDISIHVGTFPMWRDVDENDIFINGITGEMWEQMYASIYNANLIITLLTQVDDPSLPNELKDKITGEAQFIRALNYYYLVNLFGEVPLITEPVSNIQDVNVAKASVDQLYDSILKDLASAENKVQNSEDRTRVSKSAINALYAKVYLTQKNWSLAREKALHIVNDPIGAYSLESDYAELFNSGISNEAIFLVPFNSTDQNVLSFNYWDKPNGRHEVAPSDAFVNSFEIGDVRADATYADATDGSSLFFMKKYQDFATGTDGAYVFRFAEIILILAEAEAELGNFAEAKIYLNQVRNRAGLNDLDLDQNNFKSVILDERKIELGFEGGNRWLDMLRSGLAAEFVSDKELPSCQTLFPIPLTEIDANNAIVQNPCY